MDTYLVTGGAGFIGSHIVDLLLSRGGRVRVLDDFSTGRRENLKDIRNDIEVIEGDIRDCETVKRAVRGCRFVLHQAALPSVPRSIEDPLTSHQVNVDGTLNLLLAARDEGVERFVYASSSSVYGNSPTTPKSEDMPPSPLSPYAVGKLTGECYCSVFSRVYGLRCVSLRYFNVFGPRQDPLSPYAAVIPKFFLALCGKGELVIDGDGGQTRDFTYVGNVAEANLLACGADIGGSDVLNIACGESTSVSELLSLIAETLGVKASPRHGEPRVGDVRHSRADIKRAMERIGYRPRVGLREGLRIAAPYYKKLAKDKQSQILFNKE